MSDVFHEVDEEVRRDQLAKMWTKYNGLIVGAAVLLVLSVAGWRFYEYRERTAAEAQGAQFDAAMRLLREDRAEEGEKALEAITKGDAKGYATIARFRLAAQQGRTSAATGAAAFDALARDASLDPAFQSLARLRAAMLRLDDQPYAEARAALEPLATTDGIWRHTARELLGVSALKAGNLEEAGRWFDALITDPQAPGALRQRGDLYLALVRGGPVSTAP